MAGLLGQALRGQGSAMTVVWSRRAIRHLAALRRYIARENPRAAQGVAQSILRAVELLQDHPQIGRAGRVPGTRELVIPKTPFVVPYRVRGGRLELIAVFHGRQRWPEDL